MASVIQVKGAWRAQVRRKGFEKQTATFATEEEARRWSRGVEVKMDRNVDPGANAQLTVGEVLQVYLEERSKPLSQSQRTRVKHLDTHLGKERVMRLLPADLEAFCRHRIEVDGVKPESTRMDVNQLSAAFKYYTWKRNVQMPTVVKDSRVGLKEEGLISGGQARSRERRPEEAELKAVLAHLPQQYHDVLRFAIASAMRRSEIARLKWSDVKEADRCIWVRQRKHPTEKERNDGLVPLLGAAWTILKRQPRRPGEDRIFPFVPEDYTEAFRKACLIAGVENLRGHDLRHEGISRLFEAGLSIPQVAMISGHKSWSQLQKYTHLKPKDLHRHAAPSLDTVVE